jgi:multicomponent Na+:H+ antiporter subunit D
VTPSALLWLTLLIPLAGALAVVLLGRHPNARESATLAAATALFVAVAAVYRAFDAGAVMTVSIAEPMPGLPLALSVEPLGLLFALVASFLWIVTSIYAIGYMRAHHEENQTRFYAAFAVSLASAMGVAFAANMFTLFIFYEALTLATYPLVTHAGTDEARRGGRVYLGVLMGTSIGLLLLGIVWTWAVAGTLDFRAGGILPAELDPGLVAVLYALYVFGIGKAAVMPFHRWLPAAMVAPTPVSALLHAVAVVKAGVFTILKVTVYLFGTERLAATPGIDWLLYVVAATILLGSLVAMTKDNLKARLAYSTVSQLGYVVLGAVLATKLAIAGAAVHIAMHAFGKITLFFCAGAILVAAHKTEISQMRGLGRAMPITMGAFLVASLSIIGLPPAGGMWSKWMLALGALDAGHMALVGVLMLSTLLNIAYLLPIPVRAFFSPPPAGSEPTGLREAPASCLAAIVITAAGSVALFFFVEPVRRLALSIVNG